MPCVGSFGDDALGELDAVGVVVALRSGAISAAEAVEAAIDRTLRLNPQLNGLACEARAVVDHRPELPRVSSAAGSGIGR